MSFRHTFITDFIYAGTDEAKAKIPAMTKVIKEHSRLLINEPNEQGMGYYAGHIGTSNMSLDLSDMELESLVIALEKCTPVPFRLTVMQESGAVITLSIVPRS